MKPESLKARIFLDGGNPGETREAIDFLGFLDGQTTNPTLISKNPGIRERLERGEKFSVDELLDYYMDVVKQISAMVPEGSVSVEVYADPSTPAEQMIKQGREMFSWIPNAHIKFPTNKEGLRAAEMAVTEGLRMNMTLCFAQEQAAAVYAATRGAKRGDVFVSPFIGRLDDIGLNGMDLIDNIIRMYWQGDGHVEVLTASVRNVDHLLYAIMLGSDIITVPFEVLKDWRTRAMPLPGEGFYDNTGGRKGIPYKELDLSKNRQDYDVRHELTVKGMEKFSGDWNALIGQPAAAKR